MKWERKDVYKFDASYLKWEKDKLVRFLVWSIAFFHILVTG